MKVKEILRQVENALTFENEATKASRTLSDVCTRLYAIKSVCNVAIKFEHHNEIAEKLLEYIPTFCEVWNSYAGKRYGEKTNKKIDAALKKKCSCAVYVKEERYKNELHFVPLVNGFSGCSGFDYGDFYFTFYESANNAVKLLVDNVIQEVSAEALFEALKNELEIYDIPNTLYAVRSAYTTYKSHASALMESQKELLTASHHFANIDNFHFFHNEYECLLGNGFYDFLSIEKFTTWTVSEISVEYKKAYESAGFREKYAMDNGHATREYKGIVFRYSRSAEYQDANGATYDTTRHTWTD